MLSVYKLVYEGKCCGYRVVEATVTGERLYDVQYEKGLEIGLEEQVIGEKLLVVDKDKLVTEDEVGTQIIVEDISGNVGKLSNLETLLITEVGNVKNIDNRFNPFDRLVTMKEAMLLTDKSHGTLRYHLRNGNFRQGIDYNNYGKQVMLTLDALEREFGKIDIERLRVLSVEKGEKIGVTKEELEGNCSLCSSDFKDESDVYKTSKGNICLSCYYEIKGINPDAPGIA